MLIGDRLKKFRNYLKLTQRSVAETLNCNQATIADYEKGRILPSIKVLYNITENYNLDINWLLTGKGEMFLAESGETSKDERIMQLENEIAKIKKDISLLEKENKELNIEFFERFLKFFNLKKEDIFAKI